jgi:hypothetical protein
VCTYVSLLISSFVRLQDSKNIDVLQQIEFTLTIPLLFVTITASGAAFIPTGVLQQIFTLVFVSHALSGPILYTVRATVKETEETGTDATLKESRLKNNSCAVAMLVLAFVLMQIFAITAKFQYVLTSNDYYGTGGSFNILIYIMAALHATIMVIHAYMCLPFLQIFYRQISGQMQTNDLTRWSLDKSHKSALDYGWMWYGLLGTLFRITLAWFIYVAATQKDFSVYSCDVWEGRYRSAIPEV